MSGFIVVAAALTFAALAALFYPLLRRREGSPEAWRSAGVLGIVILVASAALYPTWSNFEWNVPEAAPDSPQAMVGQLARRLEREPEDLQGWLLLGRSYLVIGQYDLSARAYQRADTLAKGQNAEALLGLGESLLESGSSDLAGRAGRVFEQAMKLDPKSVKALFYSAFAARERNELPLARERFQLLLGANPPATVAELIQTELLAMAAQEQLGGAAPPPTSPGSPAMGAGASSAGAVAAAVTVQLRVVMGASVAGNAVAGAPLFISARKPGVRGPPLVAKRLDARFPQDVELLNTDAVMGGTGFAAGDELEIEARVGNGGTAISRSGDPFGVVRIKAGESRRATLEISQLKP